MEVGSPCWGIFQAETPRTSLVAKLKVDWPRSASKGLDPIALVNFFVPVLDFGSFQVHGLTICDYDHLRKCPPIRVRRDSPLVIE